MSKRLRAATAVVLKALSIAEASQAADSADPRGVWLMEQRVAAVEIYSCGPQLCGRIVWLSSPLDQSGQPRRDRENPNPSARNEPLCGLTVVDGLQRSGATAWDNGSVYNPVDGRRYRANIRLVGSDLLEVHAYLGLPMFGKSQHWSRISYSTSSATASPQCRAITPEELRSASISMH